MWRGKRGKECALPVSECFFERVGNRSEPGSHRFGEELGADVSVERISENLIGDSEALRKVQAEVCAVARRGYRNVLVQGESGVGKELVAQLLQQSSPRQGRPFEVFDCPSVPEDHLESEFFGTVRGAFPGSVDRRGVLERADGGTVFLDEIGAMRLAHQAKLLRVMEGKSFRRLGGTRAITCDVAFIAAAHQDLASLSACGQFRHDLYFRLIRDGVIAIPPLRERREDIPALVLHCLRRHAGEGDGGAWRSEGVELAALKVLQDYDWPGNVRQLFSVVQMAVRLTPGVLAVSSVAEAIRRTEPRGRAGEGKPFSVLTDEVALDAAFSFETAVREMRRELLLAAYRRSGGNKTKAGIALGFHLRAGTDRTQARGASLSAAQKSLALRRFRYWAWRLQVTLKSLLI